MLLWGAIWGAVLGFVVDRYDVGFGIVLGALLGMFAARTLRNAVRKEARSEVLKQLAAQQLVGQAQGVAALAAASGLATNTSPAAPAGLPVAASQPMDAEVSADLPDFKDTMPALAPEGSAVGTAQGSPDIPGALKPDLLTRAFAAARNWLLGGNTVVRMGVLVLFVGLAFLAKYAIDNAMLPPELRLAAIGTAGIALFVFGWKLHQRQPDRLAYALTLQGAGVGVLYLTVFAAFRLYQFLPAGAAFVVLGLVCAFSTAIALLQNAMLMAFIGFAGAFAAPILLSTGQGDHVGLFSYYLLLGAAIVTVAWLRAWRALNLLGFFATFGVATLWGVLKYQPEQLASTEPFLVAFFALYLAASLMYATRHGLMPKQAVDATLIFGLPLVAFGLQVALVRELEYAAAFSALVLGAVYLALGAWALRRRDAGVGQWLAECFVALGLGFVTLAVPLALDARWTTAVWAAEGAAVYWMGQRQARWLARLAGLALQLFAALSYLRAIDHLQTSVWPLANPGFIGAVLLAASALAIAHWSRSAATAPGSAWAQQCVALEQRLSPVLFWAGFLWWQFALGYEIERGALDPWGQWTPIFDSALQSYLEMLVWLGSAWLAHRLALPDRPQPWPIAATPAWFSLPIMLLVALYGMLASRHVFASWGWLVWPVALAAHFVTLRHLDRMLPQRWWGWVHSGGVWLLVLLVGNLLVWSVQQAHLQGTAWASVILLVASVMVLLALTAPALYAPASMLRARWPLDRFALAYLWRAAVPLAAAVGLGAMVVAVHSDGNARPLPFVPLLNPTDITVALALGACALWLSRVRQSDLAVPKAVLSVGWTLLLAGLAFIALNTAWLRAVHHWAGVPWNASRLYASFLVQTGYSILWTVLATGLMLLAHRRHVRRVWMGGAALLGLTVLKLFLVDLSNRGGSERIVAFIAVGALMLVVGYFAPIPPAAAAIPTVADKEPL
ncbi:MAG TPA: DUF2339 domain-containing protein [Rhodoferax sp.]|nr:DUF2339 domain-containing protein [Rhodoferax sp.]